MSDRSEAYANDGLSVGMAYVARQQRIGARMDAKQANKGRRYWGWNHKALAIALGLMVAGTLTQSTKCMGLACVVLCFGIRPYWK